MWEVNETHWRWGGHHRWAFEIPLAKKFVPWNMMQPLVSWGSFVRLNRTRNLKDFTGLFT